MDGNRLLIVEDHAATRAALQILFARRGWEVTEAGTVSEALARLDPPPDYLLLDLMLPDGDGESVLRMVREAALGTRVAVLTGLQDPLRLGRVEGLHPDVLLRKPFDVAAVWRVGSTA
jgi:DNA-binding response OmpR family regulator